MKRMACLVALMALSSPACARGYSFTFHGHQIHIASHCRSLSCVSVSGMGNWRNRHDDDVATTSNPAPAPVQTQPAPTPAPAVAQPQVQQASAPAPAAPPVTRAQTLPPIVQPQPARAAPTLASAPPVPPPAVGFETPKPQQRPTPPAAVAQNTAVPPPAIDKPQENPQARPAAAPPAATVGRVSQQTEDTVADSPLGDWQTDAKNGGLVRIEACGTALCGYAFDPSRGTKGETVLVNMKPKNDTKWTGNVYSRTSGNSYYGTMTLKQDRDTLRVEACALGQFFCSGNNWTRVESNRSVKAGELVTSRRGTPNSGS